MAQFKTNAMRIIERAKKSYKHFEYDPSETDASNVAELLGQNRERVFKTLVTVSGKGNNYVFIIPAGETLDLKKAAFSVGEKSVSMIKQKELLPLTGYIHGGCSPFGMKKPFPTVIHESASSYETVFVSAGQVGHQVEVSPDIIIELCRAKYEYLIM